ncbi:hypothetical protein QG37_03814 [Candidozyma auris]|uniref:Uncharacterized protein n=1 Tax=Candidozyma auris TaxID=498019 RepID=A0A0L0NYL6_CANAR|nr:hypothetical protein QG37_03814 [[Candida] auris]
MQARKSQTISGFQSATEMCDREFMLDEEENKKTCMLPKRGKKKLKKKKVINWKSAFLSMSLSIRVWK